MKPNLKRIDANIPYLKISTTSSPEPEAGNNRTSSFEIPSAAPKSDNTEQIQDESKLLHLTNPKHISVTAQDNSNKTPTLPNLAPKFNSNKNSNNIALETNPLPEEPMDIIACEVKLQQIVQQIRDLYHEGPLVDGWLEFCPSITDKSSQASYRLCGLDADGNIWSHPCPPEQLPCVSIAIARYQQILQLLKHKRHIETRLGSLTHSSPDK